MDIVTQCIVNTRVYKYHKSKNIIDNNRIVVLKVGKNSSILIMDKEDYVNKFEEKIKDGIRKGVFDITIDTLKISKNSSVFCRN